jgi:hypothetical protein
VDAVAKQYAELLAMPAVGIVLDAYLDGGRRLAVRAAVPRLP